ncbi:uncharacterized protein BYT42DRAFT_589150 [Radiomyces spectabilis]|uniref:uncharacterized protein n=1 Tax=Radiomyces spectabilis TaxID=64574 RepID=UPI002220D87D|nr:uncharacterized protein BYT42DRAFT_589150 [Radiomyces spectabilis]KAI8365203.1 hypothetical protein BYT42DRAFT_589150 [Radiomyces spectabilis]
MTNQSPASPVPSQELDNRHSFTASANSGIDSNSNASPDETKTANTVSKSNLEKDEPLPAENDVASSSCIDSPNVPTSVQPTTADIFSQTVPEGSGQDTAQPEAAQEYLVKQIDWIYDEEKAPRRISIVTQNENGPCPLISICNVLLLRGDIDILPPDREKVTFGYLVGLLGDYLLTHGPPESQGTMTSSAAVVSSSPLSASPVGEESKLESRPIHNLVPRQSTAEYVLTYRHNLDAALSMLPNLQTGLDVNVRFSSTRDFEPTAELAMFDLFDVDLVHGWIADPQDAETYRIVVEQCGSYNAVVECIVRGDTLASGAAINNTEEQQTDAEQPSTPGNEQAIHDGLVAAEFLQDTATQLTYYGLELLLDTIARGKICVLFRNNHFSTVYKHPETERLYMLVTDSSLASERSFVWESLSDVDQGMSEFFDSHFQKPHETGLPSSPQLHGQTSGSDDRTDLDYAIALSLQQQDQAYQQAQHNTSLHVPSTSSALPLPHTPTQASPSLGPQHHHPQASPASSKKKKQNCIIS